MSQTLLSRHARLQSTIDHLRALAGDGSNSDILADLDSASRRLVEARFTLVVLGEFKRGKSTLVNALLHGPVLPMGVIPLTSIVTEVEYGPHPAARIELLDGSSQPIRLDELSGYVTESQNPRNRKGVRRARVFAPSPILRDGVTIVDTPGVGSVLQHNSEITFQFLGEADAVVMVLAADQPVSAEEQKLLLAVGTITEHMLVAVNRIDLLSADEAATSLQFIRETLATMGMSAAVVLPIAARPALEARASGHPAPEAFDVFEQALRRVLIERKSVILGGRGLSIARRTAALIALRLESERQTLRLSRHEREAASQQFQNVAGAIARDVDQSVALLKHDVEGIHGIEIPRLANATRARVRALVWPRVERAIEEGLALRRSVQELSIAVGQWVVDALALHDLRETDTLVQDQLDRALEQHAARVHEAAGRVIDLANRLLGMDAAVPESTAQLPERKRFYLRDWDYSGGTTPGHEWWLHLPRRWAEPRARRSLAALVDRRIDQNLAAIRFDWVTRLDDAIRVFEASTRAQVVQIVAILDSALERTRTQQEAIAGTEQGEVDRIESRLCELRRLQQELEHDTVSVGPVSLD